MRDIVHRVIMRLNQTEWPAFVKSCPGVYPDIHRLCADGKTKYLQFWLDAGADFNEYKDCSCVNSWDYVSISYYTNNVRLEKWELDHHGRLRRPIYFAIINGHLDTVKYLVSVDCKTKMDKYSSSKDSLGTSPLVLACMSHSHCMVRYIIKTDSFKCDGKMWSDAISFALTRRDLFNDNIDYQNYNLLSGRQAAWRKEHPDVMETMLECANNFDIHEVLKKICIGGWVRWVEILRNKMKSDSRFIEAVHKLSLSDVIEFPEFTEILLNKGHDPNKISYSSRRYENSYRCNYLSDISCSAKYTDDKDKHMGTIFWNACVMYRRRMNDSRERINHSILLMLKAGGNVCTHGQHGCSPLYNIYSTEDTKLFNLFLRHVDSYDNKAIDFLRSVCFNSGDLDTFIKITPMKGYQMYYQRSSCLDTCLEIYNSNTKTSENHLMKMQLMFAHLIDAGAIPKRNCLKFESVRINYYAVPFSPKHTRFFTPLKRKKIEQMFLGRTFGFDAISNEILFNIIKYL